jgi:hypothetical protein
LEPQKGLLIFINMKKMLFVLATVLGISANASHLLGGYTQVIQRGFSDTVDIVVTLFSDPQGIPGPGSISITEWKSVNNFYQQNSTFTLTQLTTATWQGVNVTVYAGIRVLTVGDYRFIYTNCCRGMHTNASSAFNSNFTIGLDYKKTAVGIPNSAPVLINPLPINWVTGDTATSILFAADLDGDSVRVVMDDALNQHANNTFVPLAPFSQLNNYGYYDVQGDGSITWAPNTMGQFATGYKIEEYRNGSLIGVNRIQQVYITQPGSTPNVPWPPVLIQHDMLNGDSTSISIQVNNFTSTSLTFPGVDVVQNTATSWDLLNLLPGTYKGVLRASSNSSNNDYYITLRVVSTIGIQEYNLTNLKYDVYDWYGRYVGNDLDGLKGLFVIRYSNGKSEKVFVN